MKTDQTATELSTRLFLHEINKNMSLKYVIKMKVAIFGCIITFIFLNSKTNAVTNLNTLN